jgi:hypothetical protein
LRCAGADRDPPSLKQETLMSKLLCVAAVSIAAASLVLGGCAAFNNLNSEVSTYGPWPAERKPATFAFERLPSQQVHPERQQQLEDAARGAVEAAGFRAAPDLGSAEYLLQVGARVTSNEPWIYNDALFWRGGLRYGYGYGYGGRWGRGPFWGLNGGFGYANSATFDREVALLIRDRKTGQLLYEARAMKDFPGTGPNPRSVTTQISRQ